MLDGELDAVANGGAQFKAVRGEYGSGKTFFLHLIRSIAMQRKLVTMHADLGPDRRLHASGGQARSLYTELSRNAATLTKPDGGAIPSIVERFVTSAMQEARDRSVQPPVVMRERLGSLSEMLGGYDFAEVINAYWRGHEDGNETLKSDAVRWLRGEFATRTDARAALGVRTIVDDANVYDHLRLMGRFVRLAGYQGLLVCLDEMVNLYKLASTQARTSNYEQILRILNDSLQGTAVGLGVLLGGTPEFLLDPRKGLYSYEALQTRLAENTFAGKGLVDLTGPTIRLSSLTPEDVYVLLGKLRHVYASGNPEAYLLPDAGIEAYMAHCAKRVGDAYFRTPRTTVKHFVDLLAVLDQNRESGWEDHLGRVEISSETNPDLAPLLDDDGRGASGSAGVAPPLGDDELRPASPR